MLSIKGLYDEVLPLEFFIRLIVKEAETVDRRVIRRKMRR